MTERLAMIFVKLFMVFIALEIFGHVMNVINSIRGWKDSKFCRNFQEKQNNFSSEMAEARKREEQNLTNYMNSISTLQSVINSVKKSLDEMVETRTKFDSAFKVMMDDINTRVAKLEGIEIPNTQEESDMEEWKQKMIAERKERVSAEGREKFGDIWKDVTEDFEDRVKKCLIGTEENRFSLGYVAEVVGNENYIYENKHHVIYIHAGKNGNGKWNSYLMDAVQIIDLLKDKSHGGFDDAYLIKWDNDPSDDVSYLYIGVN